MEEVIKKYDIDLFDATLCGLIGLLALATIVETFVRIFK